MPVHYSHRLAAAIAILASLACPYRVEACPASVFADASNKSISVRPFSADQRIAFVTGNDVKWREFVSYAREYGIAISRNHADVHEISSDPLNVIIHKASQLPLESGRRHIVEDSTLDVLDAEGRPVADVDGRSMFGINVRWDVHRIGEFVGHRAVWTVHLAYRERNKVVVFQGKIAGRIVSRAAEGPGFGPFFLPDGGSKVLAHEPGITARRLAFEAMIIGPDSENEGFLGRFEPLTDWDGEWQPSEGGDQS